MQNADIVLFSGGVSSLSFPEKSFEQNLLQTFIQLGIKKGDTIFVSSDIKMIVLNSLRAKEKITPDRIIDLLLEIIGKEGNLVFPTYNWDFCKGIPFDYKNTPSRVGSLTQCALERSDFIRTQHPIYSFAVHGKDADYLASLDYKDSFGADSIFKWFYDVGAKNLIINVSYNHSSTFVHYLEEKHNVPYRFIKNFTAPYTDKDGHTSVKTYQMFVRYLDREVLTTVDPMHEIFNEKGALKEISFGSSIIRLLDLKQAYELVEDNILNHNSDRLAIYDGQKGEQMYSLIEKMFPICRSITGNGVRETLKELKNLVPQMQLFEVPSGTQAFDWTVPKEWNINDAWVKDSLGNKIIDFKRNNLHVVGYSTPIHKKVTLDELLDMVYTLPDQPDDVPYITKYYKEGYGFCLSEKQKASLKEDTYEVYINSELKDGSLTYGEIVIPGETCDEILFSTYICHPSMANNELSGPAVAIYLAKYLKEHKNHYTYRFVFIPETIGSIVYLSKNLEVLKRNVKAGFVLTCLGDPGKFSYLSSRYGNTLADRVAQNILKFSVSEYNFYSYLDRGSDERQYNAPGIDLPVCSVMRSKYGTYKEYHTSADNLNFISASALEETYNIYIKIINALEENRTYKIKCLCEPQLGKRGLYPTTSTKKSGEIVKNMMNFIAYCDGKNDLIDISNIINVNIEELTEIVHKLKENNLLEIID